MYHSFIAEWRTCDSDTSFVNAFQSYQDNERLCAMEPWLRLKIFPPQAGIEPGPPDQQAGSKPTDLPGLPQFHNVHLRNILYTYKIIIY